MKVTGQQLIQAIKEESHLRDLAETEFSGTLHVFEGEQKRSPEAVMTDLRMREFRLARMQTAQAFYNQKVRVMVDAQSITLTEAIKRFGGAARIERLWRKTAKENQVDSSYDRHYRSRSSDTETARSAIGPQEANENARAAAKMVSELRGAIQEGNTRKVEIEWLDPSFLDQE